MKMGKYELAAELERTKAECARLTAWVNDLQSGMYINCVYCGHRYGPGEGQPTMQAALTEHISSCPKHPLRRAREDLDGIRRLVAEVAGEDPETWPTHGNAPLAISAWLCLLKLRMEETEDE